MRTHQPEIFTDKHERNDFYIALLVIVLAGVFITQTALVRPDKKPIKKTILAQVEPSDDNLVNLTQQAVEIENKEDDLQKRSTTIRNKYIPPKDREAMNPWTDKVIDKSVAKSKNKLPQEDEIDYSVNNVAEESKQKNVEVVEEVVEEVEHTKNTSLIDQENAKPTIERSENRLQNDSRLTTKEVLSSAIVEDEANREDCIIAIGLYKEPKNISKLKSSLTKSGFNVFTRQMRTVTQVGIYISCDPIISQSVLSEVQEIYAEDAFIVK